jgi:acetylornithine deacetylase
MTAAKIPSGEMIKRLVAFDTTSRNSNMPLMDFVRSYLADFGIESHLVFDETGKKANLYATCGPPDISGVMLSGHSDCVPIDGQDWNSDPFNVIERDGKLYGRGTSDMKSFIALALAAVPALARAKLKTPVHFAFSYDEEVGCLGVKRLIAQLEAMPIKPKACIVGEPTSMQVITGHKGKLSTRCHVHGLECHSALAPEGVNAVEIAAELVARLRQLARRMQDEGPFDQAFDPPFTTVHTGIIRGGTALNIVPKDCYFETEIRNLPTHDPEPLLAELEQYAEEVLLPEMRKVSKDAGISWEALPSYPGLVGQDGTDVVQLAQAFSGNEGSGCVSFGTEAGLFQRAGVPAVVCGPGSIEQAHKPNEFISLEQVAQGEAFMTKLIAQVCKH